MWKASTMEMPYLRLPTIFCGNPGHKDPGSRINLREHVEFKITEEEPRMKMVVAGREVDFIISTGSDHSVLTSFSGAFSSDSCQVQGVLTPPMKRWFTPPLHCFFHGVSFTHQFLVIPGHCTPVFGRDLLGRMRLSLSFEQSRDLESETDPKALVAAQVNKHLWEDDVPGRPVTAIPVKIALMNPSLCLYQEQEPLEPEAKAGVQPLIDKFLRCGLLKPCRSTCNSSIRPVRKETGEYQLVQDLRAVNDALPPIDPVESKPHGVLGEIPPDCCWFTVFNVSFCVPLDEASQYLFAFEWTRRQGRPQQLTWTVLPQGFRDTSRHFAEVLTRDLGDLHLPQGKALHSFNDILVCSPTRALATQHAIQALNFFAQRGYRASRSKVQLVTQRVRYMGVILTPQKQSLCHERVQAISSLPRPTTKSELRAILGKMNFCRQWIVGYGLKAKPLYKALKGGNRYHVSWGPDQENAFEQLKQELLNAPSLALPRKDTPFQLFTTEAKGIALGVLTQPLGSERRTVGYLTQQLDPVAQKWPECLRALAAAADLTKMASKVSLEQPLEVFSPHELTYVLWLEAHHWLTDRRLRKYQGLLLENPKVTLRACGPINMSSLLPCCFEVTHSSWEGLHCCVTWPAALDPPQQPWQRAHSDDQLDDVNFLFKINL